MDIVLSARNLQFMGFISYPQIDIERNRITFLCGESGCGKSTLLKLFNSTVSSSAGSILYNGEDIRDKNTILIRKEILLIPQTVFLFDGSIVDNFIMFYGFRGERILSLEEMRRFLSLCCLDLSLDSKCEMLSGGERQRVFIAICISFRSKVLMLDEPTAALDEKTTNCLFLNLKGFCAENSMTLIVSSHDQSLVSGHAQKIVTLERGLLLCAKL